MAKPDVTIGNATKRSDFLNLVKYVSQGDYLDGSAADTTLTTADFGRTVIINSASARTVYLPSVDTPQIGGWFRIVKLGAGNVTIDAADSDTINGGAAGGTLVNNVAGETFAYVTMRLVSATAWIIESGVGTWATSARTHFLSLESDRTNLVLAGQELTGALTLPEIATPATPASGKGKVYFKSDNRLYALNDNGQEGRLVQLMEVLPVMADRRWAAARATGSALLQTLIDLLASGTGSMTFSSTIPHYARLVTNTTAGNTEQLLSQNSSLLVTPAQLFDITCRIQFETLTNVRTWIGLTDAAFTTDTEDPASRHLAMFRHSSAVGSNIYALVKDGTTLSASDTGIAAAASWFTLRIVAVSSGQVDFYINGTKVVSKTANLPTSNLLLMIMVMTTLDMVAYLRVGSISAAFNG
ncbi:MAG: hypothetical protein ABFD52_08800 [Acidobacteriota bacterium]